MSSKVWMSSILSNFAVGDKPGIRAKFFNHEWNPATFRIPVSPPEIRSASMRHIQGFPLLRSQFPEAMAIFDPKRFSRTANIFYAGPFFAVKRDVAEVFSNFDLGPVGGLVPFTIFESDLVTPVNEKFFFINFDGRKNTVDIDSCVGMQPFYMDKVTGEQVYKVTSEYSDAKIALTSSAFFGPDIWAEKVVNGKFFMSDGLASSLIALGLKDTFRLHECCVS